MERQLKIGIFGSVIGALIMLFIGPILNFLWRLILNVGGALHQGYVDGIYRNAAMAGGNPHGEATLFILVLVFIIVGLFRMLEFTKARASSVLGGFATLMELATMFLLQVVLLAVLFRAVISIGTGEITESFAQRLTVLAPAISDSEYKILKARWANMRGKADYDALVGQMNKRATELGVNLPPVR